MPSTWIMSHGTAAPAPRTVAGIGLSAPGGLRSAQILRAG